MKTMNRSFVSLMVASALAAAPAISHATNGMNIDGYGPIAAAMGGTSMAYDNGTAAMMNNPATLGMASEGNRVDVALGWLGPDVDAISGFGTAASGGDSYFMPAMGWSRKSGKLAYGVGMFSQGGMGTEYGANSPMAWAADANLDGGAGANDVAMMCAMAGGTTCPKATGLDQRSEVGVGRIIFPIAYDVNDQFTIGGSVDYVWAGMDIKMTMGGMQFMDFMPTAYNPAATNSIGTANGSLVDGFAGAMAGGAFSDVNYAYFDFSDSSDFTGAAHGMGWGGKLGLTYKVSDRLTIGATYHTETDIDDLEDNGAKMTMNVDLTSGGATMLAGAPAGNPGMAGADMMMTGTIAVRDFQWPATVALGASFQVNDKLMLNADVRRIDWSDVMDAFRMTFVADNVATNGAFAGATMNMTMNQNWDDQTVIQIGGQYKPNDTWTIRAGASFSDNPIPDSTLNPLFPAIIENHFTFGLGYNLSEASEINFSYTKSEGIIQTNSNPLMMGITSDHEQDNWQIMYSHRF